MSNLLLNARFGSWFFQIARDRPWLRISRSNFHDSARVHDPAWRWFQIH
ncbi:MAG: hypothetical protein K2Y42_18130 [Hyphomicrobium sp.]|nr:hypothetical protein [Hyphomicrobium sp.]MBX9864661.1 hypothetical protein [Hyphomicrobium sp.]